MKAGDRVMKSKVLNSENVTGTILKITKDHTVVIWDGINGHWHYTATQASHLEVVNESR
jgi:hypothetical protein